MHAYVFKAKQHYEVDFFQHVRFIGQKTYHERDYQLLIEDLFRLKSQLFIANIVDASLIQGKITQRYDAVILAMGSEMQEIVYFNEDELLPTFRVYAELYRLKQWSPVLEQNEFTIVDYGDRIGFQSLEEELADELIWIENKVTLLNKLSRLQVCSLEYLWGYVFAEEDEIKRYKNNVIDLDKDDRQVISSDNSY